MPRRGRLLHIAEFLRELRPDVQGATISGYTSTVAAHLERVTGRPLIQTAMMKRYLLRVRQLKPKVTKLRMPVNRDVVKAIVSDLSADWAVRMACLLAFTCMWRVGEYTAPTVKRHPVPPGKEDPFDYVLRRSDVRYLAGAGAYSIRPRRGKTDTDLRHPEFIIKPVGGPYCPVACLRDYLAHFDGLGFAADSPLFTLAGGAFVTRRDITAAVKKHGPGFGFPSDQISSHAFRYGGAFELKDAGASWTDIMTLGRWSLKYGVEMAAHYARFSDRRAKRLSRMLRLDRGKPAQMLPTAH